jgi:hypothetical protein
VGRVGRGSSPAPRFAATSRWLRGRILDRLREVEGAGWVVVEAPIGGHDRAAIVAALERLASEGLLELDPASPLSARLPVG